MFMFKSWKSSMNLRYILDGIFIIIIAVVIQIQISKFQNQAVSYYSILGDYNAKKNALLDSSLTASQRTAAQTAFNEIELKYLNINNNAYDKLILIYYMNLILLAYFFRNIWQVIFAKLRNKSWMYIKEDLLMSLFHLFLTFLIFYRHYAIYQYKNPADPRYYKNEVITAAYIETFLSMTEILGYIILIQWIRVVLIFRVNSIFGPMLNILTKMIIEISKFLLIYGMFFLIFCSSGRLLFNGLSSFKDNTSTVITLFSASLGNFSFSMFDDPNNAVSSFNSYAYLVLFLIISNVILLNFIIAILTSIYEVLKAKSSIIYLTQIVKCRSVFGYNEYYSSMISLFIPLNILMLPLVPFILILKSKKLNLILLHISYAPVLIIGTIVFL